MYRQVPLVHQLCPDTEHLTPLEMQPGVWGKNLEFVWDLCCSTFLRYLYYTTALFHVHISRRKHAKFSVRVLLLTGSDHGVCPHNLVRPNGVPNAPRRNTTHALTTAPGWVHLVRAGRADTVVSLALRETHGHGAGTRCPGES